jgi:hypothetical protein
MAKADHMVEYGPVVIGGRIYICLARSVVFTHEQFSRDRQGLINFRGYVLSEKGSPQASDNLQILMNDVAYEQYHLFRSGSRELTSDDPKLQEP